MNAGGAESLIMEQLRHKDSNFNIRLVVHSDSNDYSGFYDEEIKALNIQVSHLPAIGSVGILQYRQEFRKLIHKIGKPDIIHSHLNAVGGLISWVAASCGIEHRIVHCHADITYSGSYLNRIKSEFSLFIMKYIVNHYGTDFWACSEAAAKRLFYKNKQSIVIPNIINVNEYLNNEDKRIKEREKLNVNENTLLLGSVGRIARIKNYEIILKAIKILYDQKYNVRFICYGRPMDKVYYHELIQLTEELDLQNIVEFAGNCGTIYNAIAAFDLFVMPSITEGFGIATLEAQAAGLPCVVSTGVPNEVDMGLGLVHKVEPHDEEAWVKALQEFRPPIPDKITIKKHISEKGYDSETECEKIYKRYSYIIEGKSR